MKHRSRLRSTLFVGLALVALPIVGGCDVKPASTPLAPTALSGSSTVLAPAAFGKSGTPATDQQLLSEIRQATARFQNIDAAFAAGYVDDGFGCIDATDFGLPASAGGMGFHLINESFHADPATDPLRPDLLVYEPEPSSSGKPKLVALEYEVFTRDWYGAGNTAPPTLLGHEFEFLDFGNYGTVFGLHIWLWRDNPNGMFQDFNPKVSCR